MKKRQQTFVVKRLENITHDLLTFANEGNEVQLLKACKLIFIAKKILMQKELTILEKKAGD